MTMGRALAVAGALVVALSGCAGHPSRAEPTQRDAPTPRAPSLGTATDHQGSLPRGERALALRVARHYQRRVTGTFVGATAFRTIGTPYDAGSACDVRKPLLTVRLVWQADANFVHSFTPNSPPDGPRKAQLITVDPSTRKVCERGAAYRDVGAAAGETLLYGRWPDPKDS
jgi:hypothetical protein